ncbi:transposase [Vibrio alginolyticus]|uniref:IS110 family transposase n=1 Tax=Vibrio alginolyticus TaxID=663 RepID=UPI00215BEF5F|nr:transposase [Vibrio alginolyticus]MCR9571768.1 transposase [Vibrio alginolyticus]
MAKITRVGVDLAKNVFHIHAVDENEKTVWQGKYSRSNWIKAIVKRTPQTATIGMEACGSAHHWERELTKLGYDVKLVAAQFVKPYVKTNKNDKVDAEAICETINRPNMRFVSVKTVEQQDLQSMHRIREELISCVFRSIPNSHFRCFSSKLSSFLHIYNILGSFVLWI